MTHGQQRQDDDDDQRNPLSVIPWPESSLPLAHPILQFCPSLRTPEQPCHGLFSGPAFGGLPGPDSGRPDTTGSEANRSRRDNPSRTAREAWTPSHCPWASRDSGIDNTSPACRPSTPSKPVPLFSCSAGGGAMMAWARPAPIRKPRTARVMSAPGRGGRPRRRRQMQTPAG